MDTNKLTIVISLLVALSVASERLVEIVKGFIPWPWLKEQNQDPTKEGIRKAVLQLLAVFAGIVTAYIASAAIPQNVGIPNDWTGKFALGLLASGGSGFWNSILTYVNKAKDIKSADAEVKKLDVQAKQALTKPGG